MTVLSRDQILAADDRITVRVPVPEWGQDAVVLVSSMSGAERVAYEDAVAALKPDAAHSLRNIVLLVTATVVDESGKPALTVDDAEALLTKNVNVVMRIFRAAAKLNLITDEAIEAHAKNSGPSPSDSPASA